MDTVCSDLLSLLGHIAVQTTMILAEMRSNLHVKETVPRPSSTECKRCFQLPYRSRDWLHVSKEHSERTPAKSGVF